MSLLHVPQLFGGETLNIWKSPLTAKKSINYELWMDFGGKIKLIKYSWVFTKITSQKSVGSFAFFPSLRCPPCQNWLSQTAADAGIMMIFCHAVMATVTNYAVFKYTSLTHRLSVACLGIQFCSRCPRSPPRTFWLHESLVTGKH